MDLKIIAIDGLDGTGKSNFSRKLFNRLQRQCEKLYNAKVLYQHFPVYENNTGNEITDYLQKVDCDNIESRMVMVDLNCKNREEWFTNFKEEHKDDKNPIILIADRYTESNIIYNALPDKDFFETVKNIREMEKNYNYPLPDLQLYAYCDFNLQIKRLNRRDTTDNYENREFLMLLAKQLITYIHSDIDSYLLFRRHYEIPMHMLDRIYVEHMKGTVLDSENYQYITERLVRTEIKRMMLGDESLTVSDLNNLDFDKSILDLAIRRYARDNAQDYISLGLS